MDSIVDVVGEDGLLRLVAAFYKQVPSDDVLGPMYPQGEFEAAEQRLADFLIYRFGGSQKYIQERGHPRLRMRHIPFAVDVDARNRWMQLMDKALEQVEFPDHVTTALRDFFGQTATFMMNR